MVKKAGCIFACLEKKSLGLLRDSMSMHVLNFLGYTSVEIFLDQRRPKAWKASSGQGVK